jgi:hypothetical protein
MAGDGEPADPGERPVGQRRVLVAGLGLGGPPEGQDLVGQVQLDRLDPRHGRSCVCRSTNARGEGGHGQPPP